MTDTRKELQEWLRICPLNFTPSEHQAAQSSWHACQAINDKRIQQLLAVIELQREALRKICRDADSRAYAEQIADEALAIKPEDVELVEVGEADFDKPAGTVNLDIYNIDFDGLHKLYTIKTKGQ